MDQMKMVMVDEAPTVAAEAEGGDSQGHEAHADEFHWKDEALTALAALGHEGETARLDGVPDSGGVGGGKRASESGSARSEGSNDSNDSMSTTSLIANGCTYTILEQFFKESKGVATQKTQKNAVDHLASIARSLEALVEILGRGVELPKPSEKD